MTENKKTEADALQLIDDAVARLRRSGALDLVEAVNRLIGASPIHSGNAAKIAANNEEKRQRLPLVFQGLVGPGATASFPIRAQIDLRLTHLVVSSETAKHFRLFDIRVGHSSQLVNVDSLALELFDVALVRADHEFSKAMEWRTEKVLVGQDVTLYATSLSLTPQRFSAIFWGETTPRSWI